MRQPSDYPVLLRPLPAADGGGYLAVVPDLPGCVSDGDTPEQAFANAQDAIASWIAAATTMKRPIPAPSPSHPELWLTAVAALNPVPRQSTATAFRGSISASLLEHAAPSPC